MVVEWSAKWKLTLNASKSKVSFFSVNTRKSEVEWKPVITINGEPLEFKPTPRLLGVTLDRQLTFGPQVEKVTKEAESKMRMMAMLANSEWGWPRDQLRMVYQTFIMSKLGYAGPSWQPWVQETGRGKLERTHNKALRLITGQMISSPLDSIHAESGLPRYEVISNRETHEII